MIDKLVWYILYITTGIWAVGLAVFVGIFLAKLVIGG